MFACLPLAALEADLRLVDLGLGEPGPGSPLPLAGPVECYVRVWLVVVHRHVRLEEAPLTARSGLSSGAAQFGGGYCGCRLWFGLGLDDPAPLQLVCCSPGGLLPGRMLGVPVDALLLLGVEFGLAVLHQGCPLRPLRGPVRVGLAALLPFQVGERALQLTQVVRQVGRCLRRGPLGGHPVGVQLPVSPLPVGYVGFAEPGRLGGMAPRGPPLRVTCGRGLADREVRVVVTGQFPVGRDRGGAVDPVLPPGRLVWYVAEQVERPVRRIGGCLFTEGLAAFVGGLGGLAGQLR